MGESLPKDLDLDFAEAPVWEEVEGDVAPPSIEDAAQAERHMKAFRHWKLEVERIRAHAAAHRDQVDRWERAQLSGPLKSMTWHETGLIGYLSRVGKKHVDMIWGRVSRVAGRKRVEILNEPAYLAWAAGKQYDPEKWKEGHEGFHEWLTGPEDGGFDMDMFQQFVKLSFAPKKKAIDDVIKTSGVFPDGTDTIVGPDSFKIDTV